MIKHARLKVHGDAACYRAMAADYRVACSASPYTSRILLARNAGARAFNVEVANLISGSMHPADLVPRQKIIAGIQALLPDATKHSIARRFNRDFTSINSALERYGADARNAIEEITTIEE